MIASASVWKALNPHLSIQEALPIRAKRQYTLTETQRIEQRNSLLKDGYCFIPSVLAPDAIATMLGCIRNLIQKQIPPVYCFMYDLFWELILEIDPILQDLLGQKYQIIPNAWTWHVDGKKPNAYFPPHRDVHEEDFIDETGMPTLFSLWIPLTDVSTKSSCMYVLPASFDPDYPHEAANWRARWEKEGHKPWPAEKLVYIRALPAPQGSLLGWNGGVFHWGSEPAPDAPERISIGYYFHSYNALKKHQGLIDLHQPFPLEKRLGIILANFQMYGRSS